MDYQSFNIVISRIFCGYDVKSIYSYPVGKVVDDKRSIEYYLPCSKKSNKEHCDNCSKCSRNAITLDIKFALSDKFVIYQIDPNINLKYGKRAIEIRSFDTLPEARAYMKSLNDALYTIIPNWELKDMDLAYLVCIIHKSYQSFECIL